jgi:putative transposase
MTGYDPTGKIVEWGAGDMKRLYRLCKSYDALQSRCTKRDTRCRQRYALRRAGRRINLKIHHLVRDLHHRLAAWLCRNYRAIILPEFETSQMIRRGKRRLNSKTARKMVTWSHGLFRQHLLHKQREYPWCRVYICTEEYTSKTCTACGHIHAHLGGNKRFRCPACGVHLDRDANGARNILLKLLTESLTPAPEGM